MWCAVFGQQQQRTASTNAVQPVTIKTPGGAMPGTESYAVDPYNGKDAVANGGRLAPGDPSRRAFAYFMMGSARCVLRRCRRLCLYASRRCPPHSQMRHSALPLSNTPPSDSPIHARAHTHTHTLTRTHSSLGGETRSIRLVL